MRLQPLVTKLDENSKYVVEMEAVDENGLVQFKGSMIAEGATDETEAEAQAMTFLQNLKESGVHPVLNECEGI